MTTISDIKSREKVSVLTGTMQFVLRAVLSALSGVMLLLAFLPCS